MEVEDFNFDLPQDLIALRPAPERDGSRLYVLMNGKAEHRRFYELPEYLEKGDLLLINDTRVLPVRLLGRKETGGLLEVVLVRKTADGEGIDKNGPAEKWEALYRGRYAGLLRISEELSLEFSGRDREVSVISKNGLFDALTKCGQMPLPPYIKRKPDDTDKERYQTVYARPGPANGDRKNRCSIAAPTAGLHFTPELLDKIKAKGVLVRSVTLHVGRGTFMPMKTLRVEDHRMEREYFEFDSSLETEINDTKSGGGKVYAVGTTATRTVESFFSGMYQPDLADALPAGSGNGKNKNIKIYGSTDIFIYPGYRFKAVDRLVTNFHLPRSTPLMLAAAIAGTVPLLKSYKDAISRGYRFFSYGDAMLLGEAEKGF
ncbi:MAG: tRNA preQ1(34) S-adenosylmethionine ribosyltransferase-isomerase QueA [Nitrospiraceae bacterium]|nr:tRNA preQ1(34) S-adenosylmethionine ribosyltransferase-isomerase QueA [Nitrospiraceae bacterium]